MLARLEELHRRCAESVLAADFAQHDVLGAREFAQLCEKTWVGDVIGLRSLNADSLEDLHRLKLVVPLLVSPKGTDGPDPHPYTAYEPWDTHGQRGDEGGWTELYYHPFQLWLAELASELFFNAPRLTPRWYEHAASDSFDPSNLQKIARWQMKSVNDLGSRTRFVRFYEVMPLLVLADQVLGPDIRGHWKGNTDAAIRLYQKGQIKDIDPQTYYDAWGAWRREFTPDRVRAIIGEARQVLAEFAEEVWSWVQYRDTMGGRSWQDLLLHTRWRQREELKGRGLACHRFRELALLASELLAFAFRGDAEDYYDPQGAPFTKKRLGAGIDVGSAQQKEFVANRFGLNPAPRVIWFVEGQSEKACLEVVSRAEGELLERAGVRVQDFKGVGTLKGLDVALLAAQVLQAKPFILADKGDQNAAKYVEQLIDRGRLAREQVFFSDPNFERANFSQVELDELRLVLDAQYGAPGGAPVVLAQFGKPEIARRLTERFVLPEIAARSNPAKRPIIAQLNVVLQEAAVIAYYRPRYHPKMSTRTQAK